MKWSRVLVAWFLVSAFSISGNAADFTGIPVVQFEFTDERGLPFQNAEPLHSLLTLQLGDPFSAHQIRNSIEYLYATGRFADVRVHAFADAGGVRVVYVLFPVTIVHDVNIHGNHALSDELLKELTSKIEGKELREEKLEELRMDVIALYHGQGYFDTKVRFRTEDTKVPHRINLRVDIDEAEPTIIEEITFVGNIAFSSKELRSVMKSKKGKRFRSDLLLDTDSEAMVRLYHDAGYLAAKPGIVNVSFSGRKAFITITGDEGPKVSVRFSGNNHLSANTLRKNLLIYSEYDISDAVIESSVDKIKSLYWEKGYADVKVTPKKRIAPGTVEIEFAIQEGRVITVTDIRIEGNTAFTADTLKAQMVLRKSRWFAHWYTPWFSSEPYREDVLAKDIDNILDRYINEGFLRARVEKEIFQPGDGDQAIVVIKIFEGPQTKVGIIVFEGNTAFTREELMAQIALKPGSPFNGLLLEEDRYRVLSAYSNKGFLYAKVEIEKKIDFQGAAANPAGERQNGEQNGASQPAAGTEKKPDGTLVDIYFKIAEDKQVVIGKIILRGNETTKDNTLIRELQVRPGSVYDYNAILKSQQKIYNLRYFGLVRFEPLQPGENKYVKDLLLTVEERPAGAVEFGGGYGNLDRLRGFVEVSHRNLFGGAEYASVRVEAGDILQRVILNYQKPWLLGHKLDNRFTLTWYDRKEINSQTREVYYQTRATAAAYGVEKIRRRLKMSLAYQLEKVDNYNVKPGAVLSPEDVGRVTISSINPGLLWDFRDDPFNPQRGSLHGIAVKEALKRLGSDADFTKVTVQTNWFMPLNNGLVGALAARAGMAWPHGETSEVPLHERFYAGGGNTIRGYIQDSVGPKGVDGETPTGGDSLLILNAEVRTHVGGGLGLVFFTDAGNVWTGQAISLHDIRASYGAGIRYNTPVGPLRVDYGQKINRRPAHFETIGGMPVFIPSESPGELHFSIGHAF